MLAGLVEFRDRVNLEMILNSDQIFLEFTTKKKKKKKTYIESCKMFSFAGYASANCYKYSNS